MKIKCEEADNYTAEMNHHQQQFFSGPSDSLQLPAPQQIFRQESGGTNYSDYFAENEPNNGVKYIDETDQYREAIQLIHRKCEFLSRDNEKLVRRLHYVKQITKQREKDVSLLKSRLDIYNDAWRTAQPENQETKDKMPSLFPVMKKYKKTKLRKNDVKVEGETGANKPSKKGESNRKRPRAEKEKDPNAPKKPANPFFQFCQEQRSILLGEFNSKLLPGEAEYSKQELTRQLASRWRSLDAADKQQYIDKYETSKQKYNLEMKFYKSNKN